MASIGNRSPRRPTRIAAVDQSETETETKTGTETGIASALDDGEAFRVFYRLALPRVYGYLLARCGDRSQAEDLTQEAFLAAVAELRRGTLPLAPLPWLLGIARHTLLDHYRRLPVSRRELPWSDAAAETSTPFPMIDDPPERATAVALAALPADQRAAVVLRHIEGFRVPEVAAALGRSVHAAESLLARGRARFRRAYAEAAAKEERDGIG